MPWRQRVLQQRRQEDHHVVEFARLAEEDDIHRLVACNVNLLRCVTDVAKNECLD